MDKLTREWQSLLDGKMYVHIDTINGVKGSVVGLNGKRECPVNNYKDADYIMKELEKTGPVVLVKH